MPMFRYVCDYTRLCLNPWNSWPQVRYVWLLTPVAHMCSIWLVVLVAVNRYWAVCRPHSVASVWTSRRTVIYVAIVISLVIVFNSPRIFEYRIEVSRVLTTDAASNWTVQSVDSNSTAIIDGEPEHTVGYGSAYNSAPVDHHQHGNESSRHGNSMVSESVQVREVKTWLGASYAYRFVYKALFVSIVLVLLPIAALVLLSVFIIRAIKQTPSYRLSQINKQRKSVNNENNAAYDLANEQQEDEPLGRIEQIRRQSRSTLRRIKVIYSTFIHTHKWYYTAV